MVNTQFVNANGFVDIEDRTAAAVFGCAIQMGVVGNYRIEYFDILNVDLVVDDIIPIADVFDNKFFYRDLRMDGGCIGVLDLKGYVLKGDGPVEQIERQTFKIRLVVRG